MIKAKTGSKAVELSKDQADMIAKMLSQKGNEEILEKLGLKTETFEEKGQEKTRLKRSGNDTYVDF